MASWIYAQTGVKRPQVPASDLSRRSATWTSVEASAASKLAEIDAIIADIMSRNEGPTADTFAEHMTGSRSSRHVVDLLRDASTQYTKAHARAATTMSTTVLAMDATAVSAEAEYARIARVPVLGLGSALAKWFLLRQVLNRAKDKLLALDGAGADAITGAYDAVSFILPPDAPTNLSMVDDPERGIVDSDIREMWDDLDEDERKAVLEQMAREWAEANGVDPDSLTIYWNDPDDPDDYRIDGVGLARRDGTIILNAERYLDDPVLLHTAVHEVQHVVQFRAVEEYEAMSQAERDAIVAGSAGDPFAAYGADIRQVAEWKDNWDTGYINAPWSDYHSQPVEVDARNSGRNDGAGMSAEDFEALLERSGVG